MTGLAFLAAASVSTVGQPCFEPGLNRIFEEASLSYKNRFMFMAGYDDEDEFDAFIQSFDLRSRVGHLTCPFMVMGGELDELAPNFREDHFKEGRSINRFTLVNFLLSY